MIPPGQCPDCTCLWQFGEHQKEITTQAEIDDQAAWVQTVVRDIATYPAALTCETELAKLTAMHRARWCQMTRPMTAPPAPTPAPDLLKLIGLAKPATINRRI